MPDSSRSSLRQRLAEGDRKSLGEASFVARQVLDDPGLVRSLVECLQDGNPTVVAHAAHALMQAGGDAPSLFQPYADRLLLILSRCTQWEIGEQLPKVLVAIELDDDQTQQLADTLIVQTKAQSNIAAASALSSLAELAASGRIAASIAEVEIEKALASPRKALAARARRVAPRLGGR